MMAWTQTNPQGQPLYEEEQWWDANLCFLASTAPPPPSTASSFPWKS